MEPGEPDGFASIPGARTTKTEVFAGTTTGVADGRGRPQRRVLVTRGVSAYRRGVVSDPSWTGARSPGHSNPEDAGADADWPDLDFDLSDLEVDLDEPPTGRQSGLRGALDEPWDSTEPNGAPRFGEGRMEDAVVGARHLPGPPTPGRARLPPPPGRLGAAALGDGTGTVVAPAPTGPPAAPPPPPGRAMSPGFPDPVERRRSAEAMVRDVLDSAPSRSDGAIPLVLTPIPVPAPSPPPLRRSARRGRGRLWVLMGAAVLALVTVGWAVWRTVASKRTGSADADGPKVADARGSAEASVVPSVDAAEPAGEAEPALDAAAAAPEHAGEDEAPVPDEDAAQGQGEPAPDPAAEPVDPDVEQEPEAEVEDAPEAVPDDAAPVAAEVGSDPTPSPGIEDETLQAAQAALDQGKAARAYELAEQSFDGRPTKAALFLMVRAGCALGSEAKAKAAFVRLPLSARDDVRRECLTAGIELGT
jgi:hypothetical protein